MRKCVVEALERFHEKLAKKGEYPWREDVWDAFKSAIHLDVEGELEVRRLLGLARVSFTSGSIPHSCTTAQAKLALDLSRMGKAEINEFCKWLIEHGDKAPHMPHMCEFLIALAKVDGV